MQVLGADVAQLDDLATTLRASATTLQGTADEVTSSLRTAWWTGAFADGYRQSWNAADRAALVEAAEILRELAVELAQQAEQQRQSSNTTTPGTSRPAPPVPPVGSVGPGAGSPAGGPGDGGASEPGILDRILGWGGDRLDDLADWRAEMQARRELVAELLGMDPDEQAARWDDLTDEQRADLLRHFPEAVMLMEGLDPDVRAEAEARYARERLDDVAISTAAAFLEAEVDIATFEVEGAARGEYRVLGDGSVQLHLRLEGDLGREFGTAAGEAEVEVGVSGEVLIAFDSADEADAFLAGLFPASTAGFGASDALPWNVGNIPAKFGGNVYDYVMSEDVRDLRGGIYAGGSIEFEGGAVDIEASAQVEGFYDFADQERGLRASGTVDASFLGATPDDSIGGARAEVAGELVLGDGNEFQSLTLSAEVGGSVPLDSLGFDLPGADGGQAASVEFSIDRDNPHAAEVTRAFASGDIGEATSLAAEHGQVVVTTSAVASGTSEEGEVTVLGQGVEYEYGTEVSTATSVHIRPPGGREFHHVYGPGSDEGIGT